MPDVSWIAAIERIAAAGALTAGLGLERELSQQPAGLRTHMLIGFGAALFTVGGLSVDGASPTRIAAQVVSGIGFLGAGAILREEHPDRIRGVTTAANIWVAAAIGLACGLGLYLPALFVAVLALVVLAVLRRVERTVLPRVRGDVVSLVVDDSRTITEVVGEARLMLGAAQVRRVSLPAEDRQRIELLVHLGAERDVAELAQQLRGLAGVRGVEVRT